MESQKKFRLIAIITYVLIVLNGNNRTSLFSLVVITLFSFGNIDQLFAFLPITGLTVNIINGNKIRTAKILLSDVMCFLLLALPLITRLTIAPIGLFNYKAFIVPTGVFVISYLVSLYLSFRQCLHMSGSVTRPL